MTLEDMRKIILIKGRATERTSEAVWDRLARDGWVFPDEYKEFLNTYGSGVINETIIVLSPIATVEMYNLFKLRDQLLQRIVSCNRHRDKCGDCLTENPVGQNNKNEFLPFVNGEQLLVCYWGKKGAPNTWPIIVDKLTLDPQPVFRVSFFEFLANSLTKKGFCAEFGDAKHKASFLPFDQLPS